ncbi:MULTISPECIES: phage tail length tape measure family protein [unclassified Sphingomonas]|uniref:phage tail length tape measure family protein n=1 Tax=unclassified Sphingomonas TaxID=196159 RepID=UPI00226A3B81|nr:MULTISPECIES: phage tail length tape measure family protein [unclassified Sphingomonas]
MASAESLVVELIAKTDGYEAKINGAATSSAGGFSKIEASASKAEAAVQSSVTGMGTSVKRAANDIEEGSARAAQATRNLGFQLSDIGTQLGGGQSPFLIFAQQAPQVIQALEDIKASGASLGTVLSSVALPAGVALVSILAPLAAGLLAGADGMDTQKGAADALTKSIHDLESATRSEINTGQRAIFVTAAQAQQDLVAVTAKRELIKAILQQRIAEAQQTYGTNTSAVMQGQGGGLAQGAYERNIGDLRSQVAAQDALVQTATGNVQRSLAKITQTRVQESLNPVLAATGKYERAVDILNRRLEKGQISNADYAKSYGSLTATKEKAVDAAQKQAGATTRGADADALAAAATNGLQRAQATLAQVRVKAAADLKSGKIDQAEYTAQVADAQRAVYSARDATKEHNKELSEAAKAAREAKAAQKELQATLEEVTRKYDPATAALKDYYKTLQDIADLQSKGAISRGDAAVLGGAAMSAESKRRGDRQNAQFKDLFGSDDPLTASNNQIEEDLKNQHRVIEEKLADEDKLKQLREDHVKSLAEVYQNLFDGNTSKIWDNYKNQGLKALAIIAARATIASFSKGGGGAGSLFGNLLSGLQGALAGGGGSGGGLSLPTFASGGSFMIGGEGGVDRNTLSLNGQPIAAVSKGESLSIGTRAAAARSGGTTVMQTIHVDGRNSVTPAKFAEELLTRANSFAAQAAGTAGRQALEAGPGRLNQKTTLGT